MEEELTYEEAMKQLDKIVSDIDEGKLDIDSLASQIREAKRLVTFCKGILTKVEKDVKEAMN